MKKMIIAYIILAAITFAISILLKEGIMLFPYETDNCHKCISGEYYGL
jgi:hypothetical protein